MQLLLHVHRKHRKTSWKLKKKENFLEKKYSDAGNMQEENLRKKGHINKKIKRHSLLAKDNSFGGDVRVVRASYEPQRIFWDGDAARSTQMSCRLPTKYKIPPFSSRDRQHARHSCQPGCIVITEIPQGLQLAPHTKNFKRGIYNPDCFTFTVYYVA